MSPPGSTLLSFSIDQRLSKQSITVSFWFALKEEISNFNTVDISFQVINNQKLIDKFPVSLKVNQISKKDSQTGHATFSAEVRLRGLKIEELRDGKGQPIRLHSKIWNFFKLTMNYHEMDQRYYVEYLLLTVSPPFSTSSIFTHKQRKHGVFSDDGSIRTEFFRTNLQARISRLKIYEGNFGNFVDGDTFGVKDFINPMTQFCRVSSTMNYYKLNFDKNQRILEKNIKEECDFCTVKTEQETPSSGYSEFGIVWNGDFCASECYMGQEKDIKTGSCWQYIPQLGNVSVFNRNSSQFDKFLCGNGIVESSNNETCERYGMKFNPNCTDICQSKERVVCRIDYLSQSSCSPCSLDYCNKYMGVGNDLFFRNDCLFKCKFYENADINKLSDLSNLVDIQVYQDQTDKSLKTCSSFAFNVEEKLEQQEGNSIAFEYCKQCIMNDGKTKKTLTSDELYIKDKLFKLCFPVERETELSVGSFILSDIFIKIMGYYTIVTALILALITPIILMPTNTSVIFYSFWELLQVNYMWSYHLARDSASRQLFKNLKFVNFEFDFINPFLSRFILSQMVDEYMGIKLLTEQGRIQYSEKDYTIYKIAYEKYFQNGKIAVLMYDAAPLMDIILSLIFLTIFFKFTHHLCTVVFVDSRSSIIKFLGFMRKLFGKKLYLRIFFEIQPVLMFHCLSQGLFFNTDAERMFSLFTLTNKIVLALVMFTVVFGLPVYSLLAIFGIHQDPSIEAMIYKSAKTSKKNQKPRSISSLFYLNMMRKMLFSLMFLPALESGNSAWFAFLIMLIQIITLTIIINKFPYVNDIVNYNQFGTSFIQMMAALTILVDKVVDNLKVLSLNAESKQAIRAYEMFREHILILTFLTMITVYMVSALAMIWIGKKKLKNFYLKIIYGYDEQDDIMENFKGIQLVSLPRY